jgi:hypothetical protein
VTRLHRWSLEQLQRIAGDESNPHHDEARRILEDSRVREGLRELELLRLELSQALSKYRVH